MQFAEDLAVARRFAPEFVFHPDERFYPIAMDTYVADCELVDMRAPGNPVPGLPAPLTAEALGEWASTHDDRQRYTLRVKEGPLAHCMTLDSRSGVGRAPLYYVVNRASDVSLCVTYYVFYAYNAATRVAGCFEMGAHYADIETVQVDAERVLPGGSWVAKRVYCSKHSGGTWADVARREIGTVGDTHPIVYVALNSHAHYETPGTRWRFGGFAPERVSDTGNGGVLWVPNALVDARLHPCAGVYGGQWGDGAVAGLCTRQSWRGPDVAGAFMCA
jgi:hypothetical protein